MANDIKRFPVPLIFKKILKDSLSGRLVIYKDNQAKELYFLDGVLQFARTPYKQERLGQVLLAEGKCTREQLETVLKIQKTSGTSRKIGELLVKRAGVSMSHIFAALKTQMKLIASTTFALTEGEWRFIVGKPTLEKNQKFNTRLIDVFQMGVRSIKDISFYKKKCLTRSPVATNLPEMVRNSLAPDQLKFFTNISVYSAASVEMIIPVMKMPEENFWQHLIFFYLLNLVDFVEFTVDEERNQKIEELNDLYQKFNQDESDMDYYEVFGLKPSTPRDKIKEAYFDFSEKYHPDRINAAPDSTVMMKANAVLAQINNAYSVLSDKDKKKDYDIQRFRQASHGDGQQQADRKRNARNLYLKANALHKHKKYSEAATLLEEAIRADENKANYHLALGLCQAKIPQEKKKAEQHLHRAAELEPWNADPLFALGDLYKSEGLVKKAEEYFRKALEINMEHTLAGQAIKDMGRLLAPSKKKFSIFGKK